MATTADLQSILNKHENHITAAAVNVNGAIFTGSRHYKIINDLAKSNPDLYITQEMQGFVDDYGNFLSRYEAAELAFKCGQIKRYKTRLLSEDIWP